MYDFKNGFTIGDHDYIWGKTLSEVAEIVPNPYILTGGWPYIRIPCISVLAMPALECEVRAPALDRPVMQLNFELVGTGPDTTTNAAYWTSRIIQLFGAPSSESKHETNPFSPSGAITRSYRWNTEDIRISLSVYGGVRQTNAGLASAGLFVDWVNEKLAAKSYLAHFLDSQSQLEDLADQHLKLQYYQTNQEQKPYYRPDYGASDPLKALKDDILRQSQKALYARTLFDAPKAIRSNLNPEKITLWKTTDGLQWGISTFSDCTWFRRDHLPRIDWSILLPAKGPGEMRLQVGELNIIGMSNALVIRGLVLDLEDFLHIQIKGSESFDE